MNEIKVIYDEELQQSVVSSLQIAENFNKQHKNVIQVIENIKAENSAVTEMYYETTYQSGSGKNYKMYLMNRDGFSLLVMGFTGKDALEWKLKYINAFNEMEKTIIDPFQGMSAEMKGIILCDKKLVEQETRIQYLEDTKFINPKQKGDIKKCVNRLVADVCGGMHTATYKELNKKLYSNAYRKLFKHLCVSQIAEIPFVKYEDAYSYISGWYPDYELLIQINSLNKCNSVGDLNAI